MVRAQGEIGQTGFTLLEVAVALALAAALLLALGAALASQAEVYGASQDDANVFLPAHAALQRIRNELATAVQSPSGVTAAPVYSVSGTSFTFRPAIGYIGRDDPEYAAASAAGLVSINDVRYAPFVKTIAYDAAAETVTISVAGTLPAGMKATEVIARDVVEFAFFDAESQADPPAPATTSTWVVGVRLTTRRPSVAPGARGQPVFSSPAGVPLTARVRVLPELIFSTQGKPAVGP